MTGRLTLPALDLMAAASPLTAAKGVLGPEQTLTPQKVAQVLKLKAVGRVLVALADIALVGEMFHYADGGCDTKDWRRFCRACERLGLASDPESWSTWDFHPEKAVFRVFEKRVRKKPRVLNLDESKAKALELLVEVGDGPRKKLVTDGTVFAYRLEAMTTLVWASSQQMAYEWENS